MVAFIDLTGQTFTRWTVLHHLPKIPGHKTQWLCRCLCGVERAALTGELRRGNSKSCGCLNRETGNPSVRKDIAGQRFGRAVAVAPNGFHGPRVLWQCVCDCGGQFTATVTSLLRGSTKSCGCIRREMAHQKSFLDIKGRQSGWLTALERGPNAPNGTVRWWCECKCGSRVLRPSGPLVSGNVISCGCAKPSTYSGPPIRSDAARTKASVQRHNRRARLAGAGGRHTAKQITELYKRQKGKCAEPTCRVKLNGTYHKDHILPVALGGGSEIANIQLLCEPCNMSKCAKHPIAWAQEMGRLF